MKFLGFRKSEIATSSTQVPTNKKRSALFWLVLVQIFLLAIAAGLSIANPILQRKRAIDRLRSLGGIVYEEPRGPRWLNRIARNIPLHKSSRVVGVDLSSANVTDETMELLAAFPDIRFLTIHGPEITAKGLENLHELNNLRSLLLINCPHIAADEEKTLHEAHPQISISRRGSALLGITGRGHGWGCEIISVRPHSSASRAGLRVGDIIIAFGGSRIGGFDSLTDSISKYRPQDEVSIRYFRGRRRYSTDVTLGSWTDEVY